MILLKPLCSFHFTLRVTANPKEHKPYAQNLARLFIAPRIKRKLFTMGSEVTRALAQLCRTSVPTTISLAQSTPTTLARFVFLHLLNLFLSDLCTLTFAPTLSSLRALFLGYLRGSLPHASPWSLLSVPPDGGLPSPSQLYLFV